MQENLLEESKTIIEVETEQDKFFTQEEPKECNIHPALGGLLYLLAFSSLIGLLIYLLTKYLIITT